jgi:YhcH/YjgK/YiaL family protein
MILDTLKNSALYSNIHPLFKTAFNYLKTTDFSTVPPGTYSIDGEKIYALVQEYETKDDIECKLEAHKKHIDIQYLFKGSEIMGHSLLYDQIPYEIHEQQDVSFYDHPSHDLKVSENEFIIFFPCDLHKPGMKLNSKAPVKKIVIKIQNGEL